MSWLRRAVVANTVLGVLDQAAQLALALGERAEDDAGVLDELLHGLLLGVEHPQQLVRVLGEGLEVGDRRRDVGAAAREGDRGLLHPGLEGGAGGLVEGAEDLVELHRLGDLGRRQRAVLRRASGPSLLPWVSST